MKYMLLLYDVEQPQPDATPEQMQEMMAPWFKFSEDAAKIATEVAGEALHPSATATVVSVRDGKTLTSDGPFIETKEQLGGYYIFECENLDVAIKVAEMVPLIGTGYVEIRPIVDFSEYGG